MLTSMLMGLGLLLLFEGLGPLLMPRAWQQMLRLLSDQPAEQLRRIGGCLLYTSPSPRDGLLSRMPSSA